MKTSFFSDLTVITCRKLTSCISKYFIEHVCEMRKNIYFSARQSLYIYIACPILFITTLIQLKSDKNIKCKT